MGMLDSGMGMLHTGRRYAARMAIVACLYQCLMDHAQKRAATLLVGEGRRHTMSARSKVAANAVLSPRASTSSSLSSASTASIRKFCFGMMT